ncbi:MAG TPA: ATP-binding protein [Actinomycetota bacterium]|nr:ATP-binding protein [Actinomycetota bacterium]
MDTLLLVAAIGGLAAGIFGLAVARRERRRSADASARRDRERDELRARTESSEEEQRSSRLILDSMQEGVVLFDDEGRLAFANPAAELLLGPRPASIEAILPLALRDAAVRARGGSAPAIEEADAGSPSRTLQGSAIAIDGGSVLLVVRDVTEARRLDQVRRDFVANASHELKTPAATIQAAAETIITAMHDDPSVVPRFATQLEREAVRLSRIVSDLLDLSRLESGSRLDEAVALDVVLRDEGERFEDRAAEAQVALAVAAEPVPRIRGSARDLALLARNLIDNAIRYTRPGGRVDVTLETQGGDVLLSVQDTGVGIPTRDVPRIFERFYRVDRARSRETGGTGLGLSIVRHIVENHGGRISVDSELGRGTRIEVRLPAG